MGGGGGGWSQGCGGATTRGYRGFIQLIGQSLVQVLDHFQVFSTTCWAESPIITTIQHCDISYYYFFVTFCREEDDEGSQVESEERKHLEFWIPEFCFNPRLFSNPGPGPFFKILTLSNSWSSIYSWILGLSCILDPRFILYPGSLNFLRSWIWGLFFSARSNLTPPQYSPVKIHLEQR